MVGHRVPFLPPGIETIRGRQLAQPKTILSFILGVFTVVVTAGVAVAIALVGDSLTLVAIILAFIALFAIGLVVTVMRQTARDPSALMLGEITGTEYEAIRRLTLGDSSAGERVETTGLPGTPVGKDDEPEVIDGVAQIKRPADSGSES